MSIQPRVHTGTITDPSEKSKDSKIHLQSMFSLPLPHSHSSPLPMHKGCIGFLIDGVLLELVLWSQAVERKALFAVVSHHTLEWSQAALHQLPSWDPHQLFSYSQLTTLLGSENHSQITPWRAAPRTDTQRRTAIRKAESPNVLLSVAEERKCSTDWRILKTHTCCPLFLKMFFLFHPSMVLSIPWCRQIFPSH